MQYCKYNKFYTISTFLCFEVPISTRQVVSVFIPEGNRKKISCTFTGGPVPSIIWNINNHITAFTQTYVINRELLSSRGVTLGNVTSTLHVLKAQYPAYDGIYTCTGTNTISGLDYSSSDYIIIQI